jgi:NDP-sugar pyrophosphorylase family protein
VKAVILAGGEGTRLRPLTLGVPKPVVPVVDRPFLVHQIEMLREAGIREIVFSLGYRPDRIRETFGDGAAYGVGIEYAVEESPLGTGGAVKHAEPRLDARTVVLNGDVLTDVDLGSVIREHAARGCAATLLLAPVSNPAAYGLVEVGPEDRVTRFVEKPSPDQITTDTINAGIYVLETATLELIPPAVRHSIERGFFPALLARGDRVGAHVHRGYWIDIGTPEKYSEVHRDVLASRFAVDLRGRVERGGWIHPEAEVDPGAELAGPFYVGPGTRVAAGARLGPDASLGPDVVVETDATVRDSVLWSRCHVAAGAHVEGALLAEGVRIGERASVRPGARLGAGAHLPPYSRA